MIDSRRKIHTSLTLKRLSWRRFTLYLTALLTISSAVSQLVITTPAYADPASISVAGALNDQVYDYQMYHFLVSCFANADMDKVTVSGSTNEITSWEWLKGSDKHEADSVRGGMYEGKATNCDNGTDIKEAFGVFGFTNALDTFCSLSFTYNRKTGGNGKTIHGGSDATACKKGLNQDNFDGSGSLSGQRSAIEKLLDTAPNKTALAAGKGTLSNAAEYVRYFKTFTEACGPVTFVGTYADEGGGAAHNDTAYKIAQVDQTGNITDYYVTSSVKDGTNVPLVATTSTPGTHIVVNPGGKGVSRKSTNTFDYNNDAGSDWKTSGRYQSKTCGQLAVALHSDSTYPKAYALWIKSHPNAAMSEINLAGNTHKDPTTTDTSSCGVDGIGWIVCPVMSFLGSLNDAASRVIYNFLEVKSGLTTDANLAKAWEQFRNIANILFVIAFLIIIYSQLTGAGITNYGIKRLLPKLIIAAILVNVSLILCQIAVDISNIVGSSLYDILEGFTSGDSSAGASGGQWSSLTSTIIGASTIGVGLLLLVILAPTALVAIGAAALILIARQAIIILLIVVSPIAFVAYLLPNTENWFKKWWKMFSTMLLLYPTVALVFGMSTLASNIIERVGANQNSGATDINDHLMQLMALGVLAIPLFAVPTILKGALAAAGSLGTMAAKLQDKANSKAKGQVGDKYKNSAFARGRAARRQAKQQYRDRKYAEAVAGGGGKLGKLRARASRGVIGRGILPSGKYAQERVVGAAELAADNPFVEDVKAAGLGYAGLSNADVAKIASTGTHNGKKVTREELAAAHERIMSTGSFDERREALEYVASQTGTGSEHDSASLRQRSVSGAMKRGDGNIYGVGFGNKLVDGAITTKEQLAQEAVDNAAAGNVSSEHLVQSKGATSYLVDVSRGATALSPGSGTAVGNLKIAASEATGNASTSKNVTPEIADIFGKL